MAGSNNVRAGGAYVELLTKDASLRKGLDNAQKRLQQLGTAATAVGKTFLKIGTAMTAPLAAASKVFSEVGDHLAKASKRTGVGVEQLSRLGYAAEQSGTSMEGLENGLRHMQKTLGGAAEGSGEAKQALRELGLTVKDLQDLSPEQQFEKIADRLNEFADPADKATMAMRIFGKSGTELIPLLNEGSAGIRKLGKDAERLGLVWSTEDATAAEEFSDRLSDLWKVLKQTAVVVGGAVAPIFREVAMVVTENVIKINKWISAHREVIQTALKVGAGVAGAGAAFVAVGYALSGVAKAIGGVNAALGAVGSVTKFVLPLLTSGFGLAAVAAVGFGAYLLATSETGKKALSAIGDYFKGMFDTVSATVAGVTDAIKAGNWSLALDVAMKGLKVVWLQGLKPLQDAWFTFKAAVLHTMVDVFADVMSAWETTYGALVQSWTTLAKVFGDIWSAVVKTVSDSIQKIAGLSVQIAGGGLPGPVGKAFRDAGELMKTAPLGQTEKQLTDEAKKRQEVYDKAIAEQAKSTAAALKKIHDEQNAGHTGVNAGLADEITKAADDFAKKTAEFNAAKDKAHDAAAATAKARAADNLFGLPLPLNPDNIAKWAQGMFGPSRKLGEQTLNVGTFNSAAVGMLGSSVAQQQLDVQKRIEKNTRGNKIPVFR